MKKLFFLFFIIFLEGYVVLSAELLAIRQIVPFVGNGTDTVSIIIAAVLMPLAVGYFAGGQFKQGRQNLTKSTVRQKLLRNLLIAALFFVFALSFVLIERFFEILSDFGVDNRLLSTTLYAIFFIITPVFLLAQTIPKTPKNVIYSYFNKKSPIEDIYTDNLNSVYYDKERVAE